MWYLRKLPGGMGWSGSSKSFLFRYVSLELGGTTIGRTPQFHAKNLIVRPFLYHPFLGGNFH